jgi:hypothetical protein
MEDVNAMKQNCICFNGASDTNVLTRSIEELAYMVHYDACPRSNTVTPASAVSMPVVVVVLLHL